MVKLQKIITNEDLLGEIEYLADAMRELTNRVLEIEKLITNREKQMSQALVNFEKNLKVIQDDYKI
jgi:hypothetical protein